jgi:hypothetical protein
LPENVECRYCGRCHDLDTAECDHCGASLSGALKRIVCDQCGHPLPVGVDPAGACVTCAEPVYLCNKHKKKIAEDEIYCKEHESECFIATAVFGTPLDPRLDFLRRFRDEWLNNNVLGRTAVSAYYRVSPPVARRARRNEVFKIILRAMIVEPGLGLAEAVLGPEDES